MISTKSSFKHFKFIPTITLISSILLGISACQKTDTPDNEGQVSDVEASETTSLEDTKADVADKIEDESTDNGSNEALNVHSVDKDESIDVNEIAGQKERVEAVSDKALAGDDSHSANIHNQSNNKKPSLSDKQVTDVEYRDKSGQVIYVTFQTSAVDVLEADLKLPSGKRVTLTAPAGQGNNPTYRSEDGAIELVTHGGGGSIDLIYKGKTAKYEAVSAEAEVITPM